MTVYPPKMVARLEEKVAEASLSDTRAQALLMEPFRKLTLSDATTGRINLNDKLLEHAGIKGRPFWWETFPLLRFGPKRGMDQGKLQMSEMFLMR